MEAYARARFVRVSPQKTRWVINSIKNKNVEEGINILSFLHKKPARIILKVLNSAVANLKRKSPEVELSNLFIKEVYVDNGPILKRRRAVSFGRANLIRKRTSHITIKISLSRR